MKLDRRTVKVPPIERFEAKVEKTGTCWLWTAYLSGKGYGMFWVDGTNVGAHRWAYKHFVGPIPDGREVDHLCRVRHCVNPDHLEAVTSVVNNVRRLDAIAPDRDVVCRNGHNLAAVGGRRNGGCKECARESLRRSRARRGSQ